MKNHSRFGKVLEQEIDLNVIEADIYNKMNESLSFWGFRRKQRAVSIG